MRSRAILSAVVVFLFSCSFLLPWSRGNDALVGQWEPVSSDEERSKRMCSPLYPPTVEFFDDGTYAVSTPPRTIVIHAWEGSTYEVLDDGRLKVDLGGRYAVFTFRVEGNTLFLAAEGCPEVSYRRAD